MVIRRYLPKRTDCESEKPAQARAPVDLTDEEKHAFRLLVKRLDQIDALRSAFPFGKELSKEVSGRLYKQYLCLTLDSPLEDQNPNILPQCQKVYCQFKIWGKLYQNNQLSWLEKHEEIEAGMLELLFIPQPPSEPPSQSQGHGSTPLWTESEAGDEMPLPREFAVSSPILPAHEYQFQEEAQRLSSHRTLQPLSEYQIGSPIPPSSLSHVTSPGQYLETIETDLDYLYIVAEDGYIPKPVTMPDHAARSSVVDPLLRPLPSSPWPIGKVTSRSKYRTASKEFEVLPNPVAGEHVVKTTHESVEVGIEPDEYYDSPEFEQALRRLRSRRTVRRPSEHQVDPPIAPPPVRALSSQQEHGIPAPPPSSSRYDFMWGRIVWRREVFNWIRKVFPLTVQPKLTSSQTNADPEKEQQDLEKATQRMDICSRVLAQLAEDPANGTIFRQRCQQHLMELCLRRYYVPRNLRRSGIIRSNKESLNNGGTADVYHGFFGSHEVAIKSFRIRQNTAAYVRKAFAKEAMILSSLNHRHIVKFRGVIMDGTELCIIVDWMPQGDITSYVRNAPYADKEHLINQVASGLEYLHIKGVVHGDLKGENVLVNKRGQARLADFGLSSVEKAEYQNLLETESAWFKDLELSGLPESTVTVVTTLLTTVGGTPRWMSPERLSPSEFGRTSAKPCTASDVWAFGLLCYEIYTGLKPYHEYSGLIPIVKIIQGELPQERDEVPVPMWTVMEECWRRKPEDRQNMGWIRSRVELYRWMIGQAEQLRRFGEQTELGHEWGEWGALARWLDEIFEVYPALKTVAGDVYDIISDNEENARRWTLMRNNNGGILWELPENLKQTLVPSDYVLNRLRKVAGLLEGRGHNREEIRWNLLLEEPEHENSGWNADEISHLAHRRGLEEVDIFSPSYSLGI